MPYGRFFRSFMKDLTDFSMPVFKSLQQEDLVLGVQKSIFIIILLIMVLVSYLFGMVPGIIVTLIFYVPVRILTGIDANMVSIALNSLIEPDFLEG